MLTLLSQQQKVRQTLHAIKKNNKKLIQPKTICKKKLPAIKTQNKSKKITLGNKILQEKKKKQLSIQSKDSFAIHKQQVNFFDIPEDTEQLRNKLQKEINILQKEFLVKAERDKNDNQIQLLNQIIMELREKNVSLGLENLELEKYQLNLERKDLEEEKQEFQKQQMEMNNKEQNINEYMQQIENEKVYLSVAEQQVQKMFNMLKQFVDDIEQFWNQTKDNQNSNERIETLYLMINDIINQYNVIQAGNCYTDTLQYITNKENYLNEYKQFLTNKEQQLTEAENKLQIQYNELLDIQNNTTIKKIQEIKKQNEFLENENEKLAKQISKYSEDYNILHEENSKLKQLLGSINDEDKSFVDRLDKRIDYETNLQQKIIKIYKNYTNLQKNKNLKQDDIKNLNDFCKSQCLLNKTSFHP